MSDRPIEFSTPIPGLLTPTQRTFRAVFLVLLILFALSILNLRLTYKHVHHPGHIYISPENLSPSNHGFVLPHNHDN